MRVVPNVDVESIFASFKKSNFRFINIGVESGSEKVRCGFGIGSCGFLSESPSCEGLGVGSLFTVNPTSKNTFPFTLVKYINNHWGCCRQSWLVIFLDH